MQRYFVARGQINGDTVTFSADDSYHITRVMRLRPGDPVVVCDNEGMEFQVALTDVHPQQSVGQIVSRRTATSEPQIRVTLAQALLKGDKMDWVVQKGTELGVVQFLPFSSERSVVKLTDSKAVNRAERWQKIAKEAAEQARRGRMPNVFLPTDWEDVLHLIPTFDLAVIPYERESSQSLLQLWQQQPQVGNCLIIIGPEGGFEAAEIRQAKEAGAQPVHLGPRILRAETAAIAAVAYTMFASGEMEGGCP